MSTNDLETVQLEKPLGFVKKVYRGNGIAFIPHPHIKGAWVRVHPCVVDNACPHCGVGQGELCLSTLPGKKNVAHHYRRTRPQETE